MSKIQNTKKVALGRKKHRVRKKINGTSDRPRLTVYKSLKSLYGQMIDDQKGHTLLASKVVGSKNKEAARKLGEELGRLAKEKNISEVVFDRNGMTYHGVVHEIAEGVRSQGVKL